VVGVCDGRDVKLFRLLADVTSLRAALLFVTEWRFYQSSGGDASNFCMATSNCRKARFPSTQHNGRSRSNAIKASTERRN